MTYGAAAQDTPALYGGGGTFERSLGILRTERRLKGSVGSTEK